MAVSYDLGSMISVGAADRAGFDATVALDADVDEELAVSMAANTQLQVICVLDDEAKAQAERIRLRDRTDLYGLQVTVV